MSAGVITKIGSPPVVLALIALLAACGGGGGGSGGGYGGVPGTGSTPPPTSNQQVISMALPQSTIGQETDPTWGLVGGYTQTTYSQVLAFAPGSQVMLKNLASSTIHTLNVIQSNVTPGTLFPSSPSLSTTASGGATLGTGYASGNINGGQMIGPVTLSAGTYFIGCAYHYSSNQMRDALVVQSGAMPGPQATPPPSGSPGNPCPGGYC